MGAVTIMSPETEEIGSQKNNSEGTRDDSCLAERLMSLPEQIETTLQPVRKYTPAEKVCIFGLGDSSIPGEILTNYAEEYCSQYVLTMSDGRIPGWVDRTTYVILCSYSGDTPEILNVYDEAKHKDHRIHCITSGGHLLQCCKADGTPISTVPANLQSREATGYLIGTLAAVLEGIGIGHPATHLRSLLPQIRGFRDRLYSNESYLSTLTNLMSGKVMAIYSTSKLRGAAKRWKLAMNKNVRNLAFCGELPEFDHNEIVGWSDSNHCAKDLTLVILLTHCESKIMLHIVKSMIEVLENNGRKVVTIDLDGDDSTLNNIYGIMLGDALSVRLLENLS